MFNHICASFVNNNHEVIIKHRSVKGEHAIFCRRRNKSVIIIGPTTRQPATICLKLLLKEQVASPQKVAGVSLKHTFSVCLNVWEEHLCKIDAPSREKCLQRCLSFWRVLWRDIEFCKTVIENSKAVLLYWSMLSLKGSTSTAAASLCLFPADFPHKNSL